MLYVVCDISFYAKMVQSAVNHTHHIPYVIFKISQNIDLLDVLDLLRDPGISEAGIPPHTTIHHKGIGK